MSEKKSDRLELIIPRNKTGDSSGDIPQNSKVQGSDTEEGRSLDQDDGWTGNSNPLAPKMQNKFQARRNITQGMYDVALLMANVSQLKSVLDYKDHKYFTLLTVLLVTSISLHIISAVLLYIIMIIQKNEENKRRLIETQNSQVSNSTDVEKASQGGCAICCHEVCRCWKIHPLDSVATFCVFGVTLLNIFITAFLSDKREDSLS